MPVTTGRRARRLLACCLPALSGVLLSGCAGGPPIDTRYSADSQDSRVRYIILHYTEGDFDRSLRTLTKGPVSSHYLVSEQPPVVYRLVDEERRAHHAGVSAWKSDAQLNFSSIGIEIVNRGYQDTPQGRVYYPYPPEQIRLVIDLVRDIARRHGVKPENVLGHSDIAPQRKIDPGPLFPWKQFADAGLIVWPDAARVAERMKEYEGRLPEVGWFQARLALHGYAVPVHGTLDEQTRRVLIAFQTRYRPSRFDGTPDAETAALLDVLTAPLLPAPAATAPATHAH